MGVSAGMLFPFSLETSTSKGDSTTKSVTDVILLGDKIQKNLREFHSRALPLICRNEWRNKEKLRKRIEGTRE